MVPGGRLRSASLAFDVFLTDLGGPSLPWALHFGHDARIRSCPRLPPSRGTGGPHCPLAAGRHRLCESAPAGGRDALEHCRRTARQLLARADPDLRLARRRTRWFRANESRRLWRSAFALANQSRFAPLQSAPNLSPRWRPDSARRALVSVRPNPQPVYRHRSGFCRRRGARAFCVVSTVDLDWFHGFFPSQPGRARLAPGAVFENGGGIDRKSVV